LQRDLAIKVFVKQDGERVDVAHRVINRGVILIWKIKRREVFEVQWF
jgi:hypothetical protein